jgi:hypothetical protein
MVGAELLSITWAASGACLSRSRHPGT